MSGKVNSTGAVSGIIGTTVGSFDLTTATFPTGHVLQVIHGTPNTTQYTSSNWSEVTCTNITNTIINTFLGVP